MGEPPTSADVFSGGKCAVVRSTMGGSVLAATHEMYPIFGHKPCRDRVGDTEYPAFFGHSFDPIFVAV